VAVNVTEVPEQTGFAEAVMDIVTGKVGLIVTGAVAITCEHPPEAFIVLVTV
jgi:hypothetical protein